MKTLVLGGIKSGKSRLAEQLAKNSALPVTVIATATLVDEEMRVRIQRHRETRPTDWQTIEEPLQLAKALKALSGSGHCVVIDCATLWLTNLLLADEEQLTLERDNFIKAVDEHQGELVIVSNETSMGIVPTGDLTRRYCDEAGLLHQALAIKCDNVILTIAGLHHPLKGQCNV